MFTIFEIRKNYSGQPYPVDVHQIFVDSYKNGLFADMACKELNEHYGNQWRKFVVIERDSDEK